MKTSSEEEKEKEKEKNKSYTCCKNYGSNLINNTCIKFLSYPICYLTTQFLAFQFYHSMCMGSFKNLIFYSHTPYCMGLLNIMAYATQLNIAVYTGFMLMMGKMLFDYFPESFAKPKIGIKIN